jgi:MerR family transcriptional regulator, mercuric resistance operon regulatory protein
MAKELTIGRLAETAGVNVETIRYYQRHGLLDEPNKPPVGHRRYTIEAVKRVRFIKRAQKFGFTLKEIKDLLFLEDAQNCQKARLIAEQKLAQIEVRIDDLGRMRSMLKGLIAQCAADNTPCCCPIIATLSE